MVPNQIVRDFVIGALTIHSTEDTYQWHTRLPAGYVYYLEDCYLYSQTNVGATTTNGNTFQLNDTDGNLICSANTTTACPAAGVAFASISSTYRWIDCTEAAENVFVSIVNSGEGAAFTNTHIIARFSVKKPAVGG